MAAVEIADVANQTVGNRKPDCLEETCSYVCGEFVTTAF